MAKLTKNDAAIMYHDFLDSRGKRMTAVRRAIFTAVWELSKKNRVITVTAVWEHLAVDDDSAPSISSVSTTISDLREAGVLVGAVPRMRAELQVAER